MANEIWILIGFILLVLIVGGLIGYFIAKIKFKFFVRKIDKKAKLIEEDIKKLKDNNLQISTKREERDDGRKRELNGSRPIEARESKPSNTTGQFTDQGTNEGSNNLQDSKPDKTGNNEPEPTRTSRDSEENWPDFS